MNTALPGRKALPGEINGCFADRYSLAHFASGMVSAKLGMPLWGAFAGSILWELAEDSLKDNFTQLFPLATHDRMINAVGDTVAVMAGWMLVHHLEERRQEQRRRRELPVIARHLPAAARGRS